MALASHRTTLVLDSQSRTAAREIASRLGCSTSEAIRRAILRYRDQMAGVPDELRVRRLEALHRLVELFDGHDADAEILRLKSEDAGF